MAQSPEELKNRLENINAIQPLLEALRTISLSNWRFSLKKLALAKLYLKSFFEIYNELATNHNVNQQKKPETGNQNRIVLAVGSNRGLCGNFNRDIAENLKQLVFGNSESYQVVVVGERLGKIIERKNIPFNRYLPFPNAAELTPDYARVIANQIGLSGNNPNIALLFNAYRGAGKYQTIQSPIFPNEFLKISSRGKSLDEFIFDTPVEEIISLLQEDLNYLSIYYAFLLSAAAEHSNRFQLMENASKNADHLSDELFLEVQALRRQKITEEMQELAVGAGLLNKQG
jgi:F-type H+-transporting ATPase subunit gamma